MCVEKSIVKWYCVGKRKREPCGGGSLCFIYGVMGVTW